jgi:hypothetical protein
MTGPKLTRGSPRESEVPSLLTLLVQSTNTDETVQQRESERILGAKFICFTSTKVQTLTQLPSTEKERAAAEKEKALTVKQQQVPPPNAALIRCPPPNEAFR